MALTRYSDDYHLSEREGVRFSASRVNRLGERLLVSIHD